MYFNLNVGMILYILTSIFIPQRIIKSQFSQIFLCKFLSELQSGNRSNGHFEYWIFELDQQEH